jgi:hypothetical protein
LGRPVCPKGRVMDCLFVLSYACLSCCCCCVARLEGGSRGGLVVEGRGKAPVIDSRNSRMEGDYSSSLVLPLDDGRDDQGWKGVLGGIAIISARWDGK